LGKRDAGRAVLDDLGAAGDREGADAVVDNAARELSGEAVALRGLVEFDGGGEEAVVFGCEGAFEARHCSAYQMLLSKPLARPRPLGSERRARSTP